MSRPAVVGGPWAYLVVNVEQLCPLLAAVLSLSGPPWI